MCKKFKRLCSILCSILCLSGSTGTNVINAENNVASIDKKLFSKKMRQFVNSEIKSLKYNKQMNGFSPKAFRLNGRLSLLTFDSDFEKEVIETLKTMDLSSLKRRSTDNVRARLIFWCCSPAAVSAFITIIVSAITACHVSLDNREINILNRIKYDKSVKIIANHFGLEIVDSEDEIEILDPIDEEQLEEVDESTMDPYNVRKDREEFAVKMFKALLKAQIEDLFGMLPKNVADALNEFRKSEMFRSPGDKKWDIYSMLKCHWRDVCVNFGFCSALSAFLGLLGYVIFQCLIGESEEVDIIIGKIEELMKSDDLKLPKTNDSSSPNNTKKNSKKVNSSKLNFNNKKVSNKKSLNVRDNLKFGSVKSL